MSIETVTHPEYDVNIADWVKFRLTYKGGTEFISEYLQKFSSYESTVDFAERESITYCPGFAKSAINEIKNAIFQRTSDIQRLGVPKQFEVDVDHSNNTMGNFVARKILPELLSIGKVGVYVDMPVTPDRPLTLLESRDFQPYLYTYGAESIRSWVIESNRFTKLLLQDTSYTLDTDSGLPVELEKSFRLLTLSNDGVLVQFFNAEGEYTSTSLLDLKEIPFVLFDLPSSLLEDVADYQIALLNLESSDLAYAHKANFAFYVEQYDPKYDGAYQKQPGTDATYQESGTTRTGTYQDARTDEGDDKSVKVGTVQGRRYPANMDAPQFINPSTAPLLASMQKEEALKEDIRSLVSLALSNLTSSEKSKAIDIRALENGLNYVGFVLENGERNITRIWNEYVGEKGLVTIRYPKDYVLKSDEDRQKDAEGKEKLLQKVQSKTYRQEISKQVASTLLKGKIPEEDLQKIFDEIDDTEIIVSDPKVLHADLEQGLVSVDLASKIRGYPEDQVEKAKQDHAEKLKLISDAQSTEGGQARGVPETQIDQTTSVEEKVGKKQRGEAK